MRPVVHVSTNCSIVHARRSRYPNASLCCPVVALVVNHGHATLDDIVSAGKLRIHFNLATSSIAMWSGRFGFTSKTKIGESSVGMALDNFVESSVVFTLENCLPEVATCMATFPVPRFLWPSIAQELCLLHPVSAWANPAWAAGARGWFTRA